MRTISTLVLGLLPALLLLPSCPPTDDDDTTPAPDDDDSVLDDDDSGLDDDDSVEPDDDDSTSVDDDDVTGDPACTDGYEPLAVITGFEPRVRSIAVHAPTWTLAVQDDEAVYIYDVSQPAAPVQVAEYPALDLGPTGAWLDLAPADWGFVALGRTVEEPGDYWIWVQTIEVDGSGIPSLGGGTSFYLSSAGSNEENDPEVTYPNFVTSRGEDVALACRTEGASPIVTILSYAEGNLTPVSTRSVQYAVWTARPAIDSANRVILPEPYALRIAPFDTSDDHSRTDSLSVHPRTPLLTDQGWLIPTVSEFARPPLYLFDIDAMTFEEIGTTTNQFDEVIGEGAPDGATQATIYDGDLFLANDTRGLTRAPWDPGNIEVPTVGMNPTQELFEETLGEPLWPHPWPSAALVRFVERIEDHLFIGPEVGILRICPQ